MGTRACTLCYAVLSDVTQWTRDRALRRYIDCAAAHVGLCNTIGPAPCPAARHRTAKTPPRSHRLHTAGFGRGPQAPRAHRARILTSTPQRPPAIPAERRSPAGAPSGCGDPPPPRACTIAFYHCVSRVQSLNWQSQ